MLFVYLLASKPQGTLYVGVTATAKYRVDRLVWYEAHASAEAAIRREKQIKEWKRAWKIQLIEQDNPHWVDLFQGMSV